MNDDRRYLWTIGILAILFVCCCALLLPYAVSGREPPAALVGAAGTILGAITAIMRLPGGKNGKS